MPIEIKGKAFAPGIPVTDSPQYGQLQEVVESIVVVFKEESFEYIPSWKRLLITLSLRRSRVPVPCM